MRLIDADKLRKEIHMSYSDDLGIREVINEQPTAYNVDKVVERLENMRLKREEQLRACVDNDMADYLRCKMSAIAEAIEIVKSGGAE